MTKKNKKESDKVKIVKYTAIGAWAAPVTILLEIIKSIIETLFHK
ncbi:hypothetical protein AB0X62_03500 [Ligilactobacillus salivarius]|nr:hypothetical protein [Ligilactobacillus salivarius]